MGYKLKGGGSCALTVDPVRARRWVVRAPRSQPIAHIVEEQGGLDKLAEVETPTEEYYLALRQDMATRHPRASRWVLDHLLSLEAFLDKSILAGFSYGCDKAEVLVSNGKLLGHMVGHFGSRPDGERVAAVVNFAPLKEKVHVQQFLGCTNWLRWYLVKEYAHVAKIPGAYQKPGAVFPPGGLGPGDTEGDKAVRAIKLMAKYHIELAVMDEAAAVDGTRPLEQIADSSGHAWGGCCVQMSEDLSHFKVLMTAGKSLTTSQQAWTPLTLEGYAQLEMKRAQRRTLGSMRSLCWTDHANWTRQQKTVEVDPKHLRWVSEIIADGSEIRSLAGRSAKLGDGISRNPPDRDEVLQQRTKDLEGLMGQVRGFDLDAYLSEWSQTRYAEPWTLPSDAVPDRVASGVSPDAPGQELLRIAAAAGVPRRVKALYLMDYKGMSLKMAASSRLSLELRKLLPETVVDYAVAEGPYEDDKGDGAYF